MKKSLLPIAALLFCTACGNQSSSKAEAENADSIVEAVQDDATDAEPDELSAEETESDKKIIEFLTPIYDGSTQDIYDEDWIKANCTKSCIKNLKDDYVYDGEGYATWMIEGYAPGEDESPNMLESITMVKHDGKQMAKVVLSRMGGERIRILYIGCIVDGEKVMIDDYEWDWDNEDKYEVE